MEEKITVDRATEVGHSWTISGQTDHESYKNPIKAIYIWKKKPL